MNDFKNDFNNPIGAVPAPIPPALEGVTGPDPYTTEDGKNIYSKFGHRGAFSSTNPYYQQFLQSENKQDSAALYDLAIKWEGDYANLQEQREFNRGVLEEQRQYDSPAQQVARARAAGINPDITGLSGSGSGSGSGAQMNVPAMGDQQNTTAFGNYYQDEQLKLEKANTVFAGINSAANLFGALSGGVSGIMNAVSNMKVLPSQIALNEANAGLSGAKANEIQELLAGNKKKIDLSNVAQGIQNSTATLQQLAEFSNLIAPDTEDFSPILRSLGVSDENLAPYSDIIKQMHANPQMRDKYARAELSARWSEAENAQYTDASVAEMTELGYKIQYEQQYWAFNTAQLKNKISGLLNTDDFAQQTASNEMEKLRLEGAAVGLSQDEIDLRVKQLKYDTEAYLNSLVDRAATLEAIDKNIASLQASENPNSPQITAIISRLRAEKISLRGLLSNEFNQIKTHYLTTSQQYYHRNTILNPDGTIKDEGPVAKYNYFSDLTFNDLILHRRTSGEIANQWVNTAIDAAGVVVDAAGVYRGLDFNTTYRDVHGGKAKKAGYNEGWAAAENYYKP